MKPSLTIDPQKETTRIVAFLKQTFEKQQIKNAVIGLSGGIDSATSFSLLTHVLSPENLFVMHLSYTQAHLAEIERILDKAKIPAKNRKIISIKKSVDTLAENLNFTPTEATKVRFGNIAARTRMIMLFDYAKENNALVCGTENKSENLLGYFTRFGDQASDIEPIEHLYKTQIIQLATHLHVPETIIKQQPTAGLWQGQTDEGQFGFTYEEADQVLYLALEKQKTMAEIRQAGLPNAEKILQWHERNLFKHSTPYTL